MNALDRLKTLTPFAFVLLLAAAPAAAAYDSDSYGYVRVLDGTATLVQAGSRESGEAEINQPILAGDRLRLASRTRVEVVLSDRNLLRLDGGTEVAFDRLAASPDTSDRRTVLQLFEGNLQLVVDRDALGDELPRIETPNATVTIESPGTFRITAERDGWTQVVARRGSARVDSEPGSARVRAGEELVIDDGERYRPETEEAGGFDSLERWASRLDTDYDDDPRYIEDENLRYAARPLSRYGTWITIDSRPYWRPTGVDAGWRPYWLGRWTYTPSGLTWISNEPWGWVPYHYGSWDYLVGYGWVWTPGYRFAPAHVYWYWGSDYVGWCPTGYYTRYYGGLNVSFRFGVYGWASGGWGSYRNWNFVRPEHFGGRDQHRHAVPVDRYGQEGRQSPGRGIITTDTRPLRPELWRKPQEAVRTLSGWQGVEEGGRTAPGKAPRELPDVTNFIARKPRLTATELKPLAAEGAQDTLESGWRKPVAERPAGGTARETAGDKPRWTPTPEEGRKPAAETPTGRKPATEKPETQMESPSWRKPSPEKPEMQTEPPAQRKPSPEKPAETPAWRKPSTDKPEMQAEPPAQRKPSPEKPAETPAWRKPASEKPAEPPAVQRKPSVDKPETQVEPPAQRKPGTDKPKKPATPPPSRKPAPEETPPPEGDGGNG